MQKEFLPGIAKSSRRVFAKYRETFLEGFVRLIVIANVLALPVVYLLADRWLNNFAFRIDIWIIFVVPCVILLTFHLQQ